MESIQRIVMMLKNDSVADQDNKAVLKLQSTKSGLVIDLAAPTLPSQPCRLYLFDKEGNDYIGGDIKDGGFHTEIRSIPLDAVAGAAITDTKSLSFLLKSSGSSWTDIAARFKFKYTQPKPEPKQPQTAQVEPPPPKMQTDILPTPPAPEPPSACDTCPHVIRQDKINPFPSAFPNSEWVKISYPGPSGWWHYISGKILSGDTVIVKVLGVPGEYGMAPPIWLEGFGTYMRSAAPEACGYWLMFQDAETGEVLDMGLSPHGG